MIALKNVFFKYPGNTVNTLQDINLTIDKGALLGLIGPNGAGKTTLISLLTGGLKHCEGSIEVNGNKIPESIKSVKQLIGYTPQDYAFYENLTAIENLAFFAGVQRIAASEKTQRIHYCLDFCQLAHVADQKVAEFSGGLKRRLNIAIGLLADPEILIFDEPTVNIDPQSRAFILEQIKELQNLGKTIIYTSHYMEEISQICDCLAIIDHGKLIKSGTLQSLQEQQESQLCVEYKGVVGKECELNLQSRFQFTINGNNLIFSDVNRLLYDNIMHELTMNEIEITSVVFGKNSLEQVFLDLTSKSLRD